MKDKSNSVLFIRPNHYSDFQFENIRALGYNIQEPYFGNSLFLRIIRKLWFDLNLPYRDLWFNRKILKYNAKIIIIFDVLIIKDFLEWLIKAYPDSRFIFVYGNLVGRASHLLPNDISRDKVELWSFDKGDCDRYNMKHFYGGYFKRMCVEKKETEYDIIFVGKDKGRARYLLWLEKELKKLGLRVYFHIVADRMYKRFMKPYYQDMIKYNEIRELLSKSKAVLNIVLDNQTGITIRDMEAMFNGIKLITNNQTVHSCKFFSSSNIFILKDDNVSEITEFLSKPIETVSEEVLDDYLFESWLDKLLNVHKYKSEVGNNSTYNTAMKQ